MNTSSKHKSIMKKTTKLRTLIGGGLDALRVSSMDFKHHILLATTLNPV